MTRHPISRPALAMLPLLLAWSPLRADEPPLRELLRDALYAEEVARDSEKAAKQYEELLARHDAQKTFAAAALFRLAEVRRKQDRKDDAILLYQRLLAEFPNAETETRLAKENLVALGGKMPAANAVVQDAEATELARLEGLAESAPDILLDQETLLYAVEDNRAKVVKYLLGKRSKPYDEPLYGKALNSAVEEGNLEIVKLLTDAQAKIPDTVAAEAIWAAIDYERITILEFLLKKGLKPGTTDSVNGQIPTFVLAVLAGKLRGAEILLNHGVDINVMADPKPGTHFYPCGTALHRVLSFPNGKFDAVDWLLEKGAKPDLPDPYYGLTPLHYAARSESPEAPGIIAKLLEAGADPNLRSNDHSLVNDNWLNTLLMNSTPLETAIAAPGAKFEKTKLLLKHGAKPDQEGSKIAGALALLIWNNDASVPDLIEILAATGFRMHDPELLTQATHKGNSKVIELLLKYGADPNTKDDNGNSLLIQAAMKGHSGKLAPLLKAGADIHARSADGKSALRLAATGNSTASWEATKILLDAGAQPEEKWMKEGFEGASTPIQHLLIERFSIPSLANDSEIVLLLDQIRRVQTIRTSKPAGDAQAPGLAKWLLGVHVQIENFPSGEILKYHWALWRKNDSGEMIKQDIDFNAPQELPALKWGDVVTCLVEFLPGSSPYSYSDGFPQELLWLLRRSVSFPITFEIDGKSREIIVRGDRIFFDPTKQEVPLKPLQQVVEYFWMTPVEMETLPIIHVSRKGWPDIRLSYNSKEAEKFELEAGDRVKLEIPDEVNESLAKARRQFVTLKVEGYPFARSIGVLSEGKAVASSIPTLMQALVDTQVPWWSPVWMKSAANPTVDVANMHEEGAFTKFSLLPHPDLANIRIRRLMEYGAEKVIDVNLAKVIAASTGQTTAEEARKSDVMLQPGDVVEVSLLKDRLGEPWKGFSAQEESFFAKALGGRVRVTDEEGNITVRDLLYKAPRFIETEWGWIPLPPESGIASIRGVWLIPNGWINLKRGDYQSGEQQASGTFIRNGDEIQVTNPPPRLRVVPPPPPVQQPRMPRPGVVPPPQP